MLHNDIEIIVADVNVLNNYVIKLETEEIPVILEDAGLRPLEVETMADVSILVDLDYLASSDDSGIIGLYRGAVALPIRFIKAVTARKKTFAKTSLVIPISITTGAVRSTYKGGYGEGLYGDDVYLGTASAEVLYTDGLYGDGAYNGNVPSSHEGLIALPIRFIKDVAGRKKTFAKTSLVITDDIVTSGVRSTNVGKYGDGVFGENVYSHGLPGSISFNTIFGSVVSGNRTSTGSKRLGIALSSDQCTPATAAWMKAQGISSVTARWEMKPDPWTSSRAPADTIAAFCRNNGFSLRIHCVLWHIEATMFNTVTTKAAKRAQLQNFANSLVTAYGDITDVCIDVANECFNAGGTVRDTAVLESYGGANTTALYEIVNDIVSAVKAVRNIPCIYNEYGYVEWSDQAKQDACVALVQNTNVDGFGCQYHPDTDAGQPTLAGITAAVKRITDLGKQFEFTEVGIPTANPTRFTNMFTGGAAAKRITFWGGWDSNSDVSGGPGSPSQPWNSDLTPKSTIVPYAQAWATTTVIPPKQTSVAEISLASHATPATRVNHAIKIRARTVSGSGGVIKAALYEGYTNRSGDLTSSVLTNGLVEYTLSIPDASAAAITSYANLSIKLWGYSASGQALVFEVSRVSLQLPAS